MLQVVCRALSDESQVVRNAALFALGQFSENLQVSRAAKPGRGSRKPWSQPGQGRGEVGARQIRSAGWHRFWRGGGSCGQARFCTAQAGAADRCSS